MSEETVLKLPKDTNEIKAAGLDNLFGKFLNDIATVLAKPISQTANLSIKYSISPSDCKIVKLKPFKNHSPPKYRLTSLIPLVFIIIVVDQV